LAVVMPVADVLGPAPAEVGVLLEAAAGAEVADPPEVPLLLELLPQAASKTRPAAAPGAAHHRLRISLSPFRSGGVVRPPPPPARMPGRDRSREIYRAIRWQSQARDIG
jgi:hypothetical protein